MFKTGCDVIRTIFRFAKRSCCLRLLQRTFQAVLPMIMIIATQSLVVEVEAFFSKNVESFDICIRTVAFSNCVECSLRCFGSVY